MQVLEEFPVQNFDSYYLIGSLSPGLLSGATICVVLHNDVFLDWRHLHSCVPSLAKPFTCTSSTFLRSWRMQPKPAHLTGIWQPYSTQLAAVIDGVCGEGCAFGGLTLSFDISPGPLKEMDLHPILLGGGPFVVEEALRLAAKIPAAAGCPAGGLTRLPEQACNPDILLSVHNSASPTPEQPTVILCTPSGQTCCGPITQAYSICAMLPTPAKLA